MKKPKTKKEINCDLTIKEALELLAPHKEEGILKVHSFVGLGAILMGCDMSLKSVKKHFKETKRIVLSGPHMRGMGHGIAYFDEKQGYVFLETDKEKIDNINKEREAL